MKKYKRKKQANNLYLYFVIIFLLLLAFSTFYFLYAVSLLKGIENLFRSLLALIITIIFILFIYKSYKTLKTNKFLDIIKLVLFIIIYSTVLGTSSLLIDNAYGQVKRISTNSVSYSTSIVTLIDNEALTLEDIKNDKIGMIEDDLSIEGYQLPKDIMIDYELNNEVLYFDSFVSLINALYDGEVNYVFLPSNYVVLFKSIDNLEDIGDETKIIYSHSKEVVIDNDSNRSIDKPFTLLLMGVDSEEDGIKDGTFNGDSLILITFNPNTFNTTMLSIPRDTYVPISCFKSQRPNKITHASWYGHNCMIETIENFTDIDIDYYVKMNFKGIVSIVDSLGGIEVDVPYNFCEQNSDRKWGDETIYVEEGLNVLDGEQVLALARNRKPNKEHCTELWTDYTSNDFIRGQNQQAIVKGILNKLTDVRSVNVINDLFNSVSNNVETNMSIEEILSLYNIGKNAFNLSKNAPAELLFGISKLQLSGYDLTINDYSLKLNQGTKLNLYNFIPYKGSINDISLAMKKNLNIEEDDIIKTMSFSVLVPYKEPIIGVNNYNEPEIQLVPNFTKKHEDEVKAWADRNDIKLEINYITSNDSSDFIGMIKYQSAYANMEVNHIGSDGFKVNVVEKIEIIEIEKEQ